MSFKDRLSELSELSGALAYAKEGAQLCHETLKTCKIILEDLMGPGNFSAQDVLNLYPRLVSCEIEVALKEQQKKILNKTETDIDSLTLLQNKKKINNIS
jgi:hypothetical protein